MKRKLSLTSLLICAFSILAVANLQAEDKKRPDKEELIAKWDVDGDGKLSGEERKAMREGRKKEMFNKIDSNQDGAISMEEWMAFEPKGPRADKKGKTED